MTVTDERQPALAQELSDIAHELSEMARRIRECRSCHGLSDRERQCMGTAEMHLKETAEWLHGSGPRNKKAADGLAPVGRR